MFVRVFTLNEIPPLREIVIPRVKCDFKIDWGKGMLERKN